jgi:hypothetical protein
MPVDKEQIKKALDHFENDEYTEAQDIIRQEIAKHRDEWLDDKLGLEGESPEEKDEVDAADEDEDEDKDDSDGSEEE